MKHTYTLEEAKKMNITVGDKRPTNPRADLALTEQEFNRIKGIFQYWYDQPDFNKKTNGVADTFEETRTKFIKWTYEYLRQFWPRVQYKILSYDKTLEHQLCNTYKVDKLPEGMYDTVAFKFAKGRPELFLLVSDFTTVMDEMRFNAYDAPDGKFIRPNWNI